MPAFLGAVSGAVDANDAKSLVANNGAQIAALASLASASSGVGASLSADARTAAGHLSAAQTATAATDVHAALQALDTSLQTVVSDCQAAGF
ncbi:MAG TPA: hypothetical protein VFP54_08860 [Acidimicrobiales bacterium]|nr:hypothetical protein [Acidimicrobiales bacterium]